MNSSPSILIIIATIIIISYAELARSYTVYQYSENQGNPTLTASYGPVEWDKNLSILIREIKVYKLCVTNSINRGTRTPQK